MRNKKRDKKSSSFSKLIVFLIIVLNTVFAFATLYVFMRTGVEPIALTGAWFGFTGGELWLLTGIKKQKIKECIENENRLESETNV
jgi:hypothetical protein